MRNLCSECDVPTTDRHVKNVTRRVIHRPRVCLCPEFLCFREYSIERYSPIELANFSTNLGKEKTPLRQYARCKSVSSILALLWFIVPPLTVNNFNTSCKQRKCSQQPSGVEEATLLFTQKRFTDLSGHRGSSCSHPEGKGWSDE